METKVCSKCKKEKPIGEFGKNSKSKDGLLGYCKSCRNEIENSDAYKEKKKSWYIRNKIKVLAYEKSYREKKEFTYDKKKRKLQYIRNKDKETEQKKKWYKNNVLKIKEYNKEYRKKYKIDKNKMNLKRKERMKNDPLYKLKHNIRGMIGTAFKKSGCRKNKRTQEILGCSFEEFKMYIEKQFQPWMSWGNHGIYTGRKKESWHLDHIIPLASATTIEEVIGLNHYTNFQPLDSYDNQILKRDKLTWI
jgi:hypothetical protein